MSGKLLSCLCTSVPSRWGLLQRAIADFNRQSYAERELIIVVKDDNYASQISAYVDALDGIVDKQVTGPAPIKVFARPGHDVVNLLLYALAQARGDFITFWSDDNQNAVQRLDMQMTRQLALPDSVTVMTGCFYLFFDTREIFFTRFEQPSAPASDRCVPSSLIVPRDLLPPLSTFLRDHPPSKLVDAMAGAHYRRKIHFLPPWHVFMAGVRGDNLRGYEKHRLLATGLPMTVQTSALITARESFTNHLDAFLFMPGDYQVCGADGQFAFQYTPKSVWPDYLFPIGDPSGVKIIDERKGV